MLRRVSTRRCRVRLELAKQLGISNPQYRSLGGVAVCSSLRLRLKSDATGSSQWRPGWNDVDLASGAPLRSTAYGPCCEVSPTNTTRQGEYGVAAIVAAARRQAAYPVDGA